MVEQVRLGGECVVAEPRSERQQGSIMQDSVSQKKGVLHRVEVPGGISAGLECNFRSAP